jgi:hypothetical protein
MERTFTDEQVSKARHALGLDRKKLAYRNFYSCDGDADWDDLVARSMAVKRKSPVSPDWIYHLTKRAAFYFLNRGERIDEDLRFPVYETPEKLTQGVQTDDIINQSEIADPKCQKSIL